MLLVPFISVIEGRIVYPKHGDYLSKEKYSGTPIDVAKKFEDHGISRIHLIDLDGARAGSCVNYDTLRMISRYTNLSINFTGGIRTDGDVLKAFEYGAESITVASIAFSNKEQFSNWLMSYGREKLALAADSLKGKIRIKGWQKATSKDLYSHITYFYNRGLKYLKTTDISKEGLMKGPSFGFYKKLLNKFPDLSIFANGNVRTMDDIKKLRDYGLHGVIFGKAFYEGTITLKDIENYQAILD